MKSLKKLQTLIDTSRHEYEQGNVSYVVGFSDIVDEIEAELDECYAELPKDADGVPMRFGDKFTVPWHNGKVFEVAGFSYSRQMAGGERTIWVDVYDLDQRRNVPLCSAASCHHYKPPTVYDVLIECCNKYHSLLLEAMSDIPHDMPAPGEIVEEYAAKFRFAEDDE